MNKEEVDDLLSKASWFGSPFQVRARMSSSGWQELVIRKRSVKTVAMAAKFRIVHAHRHLGI